MKVAFILPKHEHLAIEYLSACLKKEDHQTSLFYDPQLFGNSLGLNNALTKIASFENRVLTSLKEYNPDLVCFSIVSDNHSWMCRLAQSIKGQTTAKIVAGGPHPTSIPKEVIKNKNIDFICIGEGEDAIVELARAIKKCQKSFKIKNIWYKKGGKVIKNGTIHLLEDLDKLPFPDKNLIYQEYPFLVEEYFIMASRGCAFNCSFCSVNILKRIYKRRYAIRMRSVSNVIEELKTAKIKYGIKSVIFYDDNFPTDKRWLEKFSLRYKEEIGLPFFCSLHPKLADEHTVFLLKKAGCSTINLGVQSLNKVTRKKYYLRHETNEDIIKAIKTIKEHNIFLRVELIVGFPPDQSNEELLDHVRFFNKNKVDSLHVYWLTYLPGARLSKVALAAGWLTKKDVHQINQATTPSPFHTRGHTFNKNLVKIVNLLILTTILDDKVIDFLIKSEMYKLLPSKNLYKFNRMIKLLFSRFKRKVPLPKHFFSIWLSYKLLTNKR